MISLGETSVPGCHSLATVSLFAAAVSADEEHTQEPTCRHDARKLDELLFT
jgi:hypothetical protein